MLRFSVIIPCYNCEATLADTVRSIRAAGLTEYEIILVDDGSTDGTAQLCDALCTACPELRCVHQVNAGVSAARNRGLDEARGDYVWFVDADDTVDAGAMSGAGHIVRTLQPDMLIFGLSFDYYHRGRLYRREPLCPPCAGPLSPGELGERFRALFDSNSLSSACTRLIRREVLGGLRFRVDLHLMEDYLFVLELLPHCRSIFCLQETIYRYRQREDETGAYRRLRRIPDLVAYLQPFETALRALALPEADALCRELYRMLLWQRLARAPLREIRAVLAVHRCSRYADCMTDGALRIYCRSRKSHARHRVAVALKRAGLYRR